MIVRVATPDGQGIGYLEHGVVHLLDLQSIGQVAKDDGRWSWSQARDRSRDSVPLSDLRLLAPIDDTTEVWGCGVTYERSLEAREEEAGSSSDIYTRVYNASRPEIFYKGVGHRCVGHGSSASIRTDSKNCVPEPELAMLVSPTGTICGFTICDDITARDLESENPLYLPQAKVWLGSCVLGPGIVPANEIDDPYALAITIGVARAGKEVFQGSSGTHLLRRRLNELAVATLSNNPQPSGFFLTTGTAIVPPWEFALEQGDSVSITIESVGTLTHSIGLQASEQEA